MAIDDSPEKAAARAAVDRAVKEFVSISGKEDHDFEDAITEGWIVIAEYTSVELVSEDKAAILWTVADDQPRSMSVGLATVASRGL